VANSSASRAPGHKPASAPFAHLDRHPSDSRPLTPGYTAKVESDSAVWGYNTELVANLVSGAGNNLMAYRSEDVRIGTAGFKALRANANYMASWGNGWLWALRGQVQCSADALISGEQFGLGGASSIRGTSERPISGGKGMLASLEVTTPEVAPGLRVLGFVDAGGLRNNNPNATNKPPSDWRRWCHGPGCTYPLPRGSGPERPAALAGGAAGAAQG